MILILPLENDNSNPTLMTNGTGRKNQDETNVEGHFKMIQFQRP